MEYVDNSGLHVGEAGFASPRYGRAMPAKAYDDAYRDPCWRRPGQPGLIPPLTGVTDPAERAIKAAGLPLGYDADYVDPEGRSPGDPGFVPPCYTADYVDPHGRRVGEQGFIPPGRSESFLLGDYDAGFRDINNRQPGEPGFLPPLLQAAGKTAEDSQQQIPGGYDEHYRAGTGTIFLVWLCLTISQSVVRYSRIIQFFLLYLWWVPF